MSWAECSTCGQTFTSDRGFERHFDPERDCRDAASARRKDGHALFRRVLKPSGRVMWALTNPPKRAFGERRLYGGKPHSQVSATRAGGRARTDATVASLRRSGVR